MERKRKEKRKNNREKGEEEEIKKKTEVIFKISQCCILPDSRIYLAICIICLFEI